MIKVILACFLSFVLGYRLKAWDEVRNLKQMIRRLKD